MCNRYRKNGRILTGERVIRILITDGRTFAVRENCLGHSFAGSLERKIFFRGDSPYSIITLEFCKSFATLKRWDVEGVETLKRWNVKSVYYSLREAEIKSTRWNFACTKLIGVLIDRTNRWSNKVRQHTAGRDVAQSNEQTRMRWRERIMLARHSVGRHQPKNLTATTKSDSIRNLRGIKGSTVSLLFPWSHLFHTSVEQICKIESHLTLTEHSFIRTTVWQCEVIFLYQFVSRATRKAKIFFWKNSLG